MRMTEEKFWLVKKLDKAQCTHKEIAQAIGCKPSSVGKFKSYKTWEEYCEFKNKYAEKVRNKKQYAQEDLREVATSYKPATLDDVIAMMEKIHEDAVDMHLAIMELVNWEVSKQKQKEEWWAKKEDEKKSWNWRSRA